MAADRETLETLLSFLDERSEVVKTAWSETVELVKQVGASSIVEAQYDPRVAFMLGRVSAQVGETRLLQALVGSLSAFEARDYEALLKPPEEPTA